MPPIFATMKGASSGLTRNTTRTSNCIVKPSLEITSNGLKVLTTSPEVHSTVWFVVGMTIGGIASQHFTLNHFGVGCVEVGSRLRGLLFFFALHALAHFRGHLAANLV